MMSGDAYDFDDGCELANYVTNSSVGVSSKTSSILHTHALDIMAGDGCDDYQTNIDLSPQDAAHTVTGSQGVSFQDIIDTWRSRNTIF